MKQFKKRLEEDLKDPEFRKAYVVEKALADIAVKIQIEREKSGLSQTELAKQAHITQQQLSNIENGKNFTVKTLLQIASVLNIKNISIPV